MGDDIEPHGLEARDGQRAVQGDVSRSRRGRRHRLLPPPGGRFKTVPAAAVRHGWWGGGRRSYRRFARWAFGDSVLPLLHLAGKYYDMPNGVESLFFGLPALAAAAAAGLLEPSVPAAWACCVALSEAAAE